VAADAAFFQRRKTIRNSMMAYAKARLASGAAPRARETYVGEVWLPTTPQGIDDLLAACDIPANSRGESHDLAAYLRLGAALAAATSTPFGQAFEQAEN
jgi:16S rRNA A1518/A1519 N6-dimethyltransferase RsmA/KsgA/DIM1 with predicted DNA glycosylase/AP lyase activity